MKTEQMRGRSGSAAKVTKMIPVEHGVAIPKESIKDRIMALEVGETYARVRQVDTSLTAAEIAVSLPAIRRQLSNDTVPAIYRAKDRTGGEYTTEVDDKLMPSGRWFVTIYVTRVG